MNLKRLRWQVLAGTALAIGAATAVTGAIGFIGLLAPHLVRATAGHEPGRVLLPAALCGAVLLLAADIATRLMPFDAGIETRCADRTGRRAVLHPGWCCA